MTYFWIAITAFGFFADISTSGFVFSVFSLGSLVALISKILGASTILQISIFAIVSIVSMFTVVPFIRKKIKQSGEEFIPQENRMLGKEFILEDELKTTLLVNIDGVFWTIKTTSGPISAGEKVKIVSIDGNKYIVEKN